MKMNEKKKKRYKRYLKINLISLLFIVISFSSLTLAWFAYSGLSSASMDIDVKGWYIELERGGKKSTNKIEVSLPEIYPGMDTVVEKVKLKNLGDYDASLKYTIETARILGKPEDNYVINEELNTEYTSEQVEDILSHNYPFHININLSRDYILSNQTDVEFEVSVSWPLSSGDDIRDSEWGMAAYKFNKDEIEKANKDSNYQKRSPIKLEIKLTAEQYVKGDESSDINYYLGQNILYDVENNQKCTEVKGNCLSTYVIDNNNLVMDDYVKVIPELNNLNILSNIEQYDSKYNTLVGNWKVETEKLKIDDILYIITEDIDNSVIVRNELSEKIIGNLKYPDRLDIELNKIINSDSEYKFMYYKFMNNRFPYLSSNTCYWTNSKFDELSTFAYDKLDEYTSKIFNQSNESECKIVPVIKINKDYLK